MRSAPQSEAYRLCERMHHKCQAIVFAETRDRQEHANTIKEVDEEGIGVQRIRENVRPSIVGIGAILAAGVCPIIVQAAGPMIVKQGRRWKGLLRDASEPPVSSQTASTPNSLAGPPSTSERLVHPRNDKGMTRRHSEDSVSSKQRGLRLLARIPTGSATPDELSRGGAFSFNRYIAKTVTSFGPTIPQSMSFDFLDRRTSASTEKNSSSDSLTLEDDKNPLKTSHYFHAELQFMMTLVEISDRLRTVPKEARQSNLVAELALLNHNLPANVCVPLWCPASGTLPYHHKVARISPSDAVVLNSADRVPFLITVEVLEDSRNATVGGGMDDPYGQSSLNLLDNQQNATGRKASISVTVEQPSSEAGEDRKTSGSEPELLSPSDAEQEKAAKYHRIVIDRRKSSVSLNSRKSISPMDPTSPDAPFSSPVIRQINGFENSKEAETSTPMSKADEFAERMRTAAVMLAQLYQQQQRELLPQAPSVAGTPSHLSNSPVVVGAGGLPATHISRYSSFPQGNAGHASTPTPTSGTIPIAPTNRRNYQKFKADFESIRNRLIKEMVTLEEQRVQALAAQLKEQEQSSIMVDDGGTDEVLPEGEEQSLRARCQVRDTDDPSAAVFQETWDTKVERIRRASPYGSDPRWRLLSMIVKSGADLRQEQLALQLIKEIQRIWREADVPVWVCCFRILITSDQSGIVETIRDAISVHSIKKDGYAKRLNEKGLAFTLYDYFVNEFGHPGSTRFLQAQDNFCRSLAAYSVICYILQIKDRHNGNILIDIQGHVIHIDFGFMLSNTPGSLGFELAPFKLPQDYVDILGGVGSEKFNEFRALVKESFLALRKKSEDFLGLVEMMEHGSALPCFTGLTTKPSNMPVPSSTDPTAFLNFMGSETDLSRAASGSTTSAPTRVGASPSSTSTAAGGGRYPVTAALRDRFHLSLTESALGELLDTLIERSCNSAYTRLYDSFQLCPPSPKYYANGIL
ncbi:kinase-like domain-containing protein [Phlyctochytrium arcticum]|nr:kinase-like domain-containing protein [Phlyctochytrium arcticum]